MDKPTKKRLTFNQAIVNALSAEFEVSTRFVRMCVKGEKKSLTADNIRKKYNEMNQPTLNAIEQFKNPDHE